MLKKTKIKILALIAATVQAASLLSGCSLFPAEEEPSVPALKTPQPIEYSFYRVKEDTLRSTVTGVGKVTSIYYTNHSFPGRRKAQGDPCDAWSDRFGGRPVNGA